LEGFRILDLVDSEEDSKLQKANETKSKQDITEKKEIKEKEIR